MRLQKEHEEEELEEEERAAWLYGSFLGQGVGDFWGLLEDVWGFLGLARDLLGVFWVWGGFLVAPEGRPVPWHCCLFSVEW